MRGRHIIIWFNLLIIFSEFHSWEKSHSHLSWRVTCDLSYIYFFFSNFHLFQIYFIHIRPKKIDSLELLNFCFWELNTTYVRIKLKCRDRWLMISMLCCFCFTFYPIFSTHSFVCNVLILSFFDDDGERFLTRKSLKAFFSVVIRSREIKFNEFDKWYIKIMLSSHVSMIQNGVVSWSIETKQKKNFNQLSFVRSLRKIEIEIVCKIASRSCEIALLVNRHCVREWEILSIFKPTLGYTMQRERLSGNCT